ncbi:MAG: phosphotransferase family protein [Thermodesulfobacteriota bacterium]
MGHIDASVDIREGEELNLARVTEFLQDTLPGVSGEVCIRQFPSGFSNLTYSIQIGDRDLILRKPPHGKKAKSAHDMAREYRILKALKPVFPYAPEALVYSEELSVVGSPFYVMERIKGMILRRNFPKDFVLPPRDAGRLCENLMDVLCRLHGLDYIEIGLEGFGKPEGYVRRQVEGWSSRYRDARTPDAPDYEQVMGWLHEHMPPDSQKPAIIHNDYKFDNVVLNPENPLEIIGVLDWEMATIGDPLMDLGSSMAYWVNRDDPENVQLIRMLPTNAEGMLSRDELVSLYLSKTGRETQCFDFYLCFGFFRLAVIAQQIYYRYYHGQTRDKRFAMLIVAVQVLEQAAKDLIGRSEL